MTFNIFKRRSEAALEQATKTVAAETAPAAHMEIPAERTHSEIMVVVVALMLAMLLAALDQTIVSTALPRIAVDLNGLNKLSWVVTSYLITSAVVTPLYGKISDQLGRKKIFMTAIIIFLIGSALCGAAQNMDQLILFRGVQGLGAGGLMALVFAIIGDIIPPRQRGRYQGYFGGVWALSSIVGPLLGGLFTDQLTWRWIFYINIPLGMIALSAIAARLHLPHRKVLHEIDLYGAGLLAGSVVSLLLVTVLGGSTYPWSSAPIYALATSGVVLGLFFIWQETRAKEPIIPLRLFKNDIFTVSSLLSLVSGAAMFGVMTFIPEYQQIVRGYSAMKSGLLMLPMVTGLMLAMIPSGRIISKTGHYRVFPIVGTAITSLGIWLFSHISLTTSQLTLSAWMLVLGFGIGLYMQVMTLAVQNSIDRKDMGAATSVVTFFRSMGASFGTALFGALLTARLTHYLHQYLPAADTANLNTASLQKSTAGLAKLPPSIVHDVLNAFAHAFQDVFLWAVPLALIAFAMSFMLREAPLKTSTKDIAEGESFEAQQA